MKQVFARSGKFIINDVPAPFARRGTVLVRTDHSSVSIGTELSNVAQSTSPLWLRALKNPDKVVKAARMVAEKGFDYTRSAAMGNMEEGIVGGYSLSGVVVEVGEGVSEFALGDRVACAGAQCAHHAEYVCVPVNLVAPVPRNVSFVDASTVALGAIALQGIRRAEPTLGETFVVIGLGFLGQLTVQILLANGCRVIGYDPISERVSTAISHGMDRSISEQDTEDDIKRITDEIGADGVIITAAVASSEVLSRAFKLCRRKGRVVIVGDIGMNIDRADIYAKELDVLISTSYGPGRYDRRYEEEGLEYPISYIRWTENRNMRAYLQLLASERVVLLNLSQKIFDLNEVGDLFDSLKKNESRPLSVMIAYKPTEASEIDRVILNPKSPPLDDALVGVGIVGAGAFVQGTHLPNLIRLKEKFSIRAIMNRTGHTAKAIANQVGAQYSTTDFEHVLNDDHISLIIVGTRHNSHADIVLGSLRAGKSVLVEKPLVLTPIELDKIEDFYKKNISNPPLLLTGFNRRFSPIVQKIGQITRDRNNPLIIDYKMNAGFIASDHWVHGPEGGGRNIGEACHIYDLFTYLVGSSVEEVKATSLGSPSGPYLSSDNFVTTIRFADGSIATLTYTSLGSPSHSKEKMEIYCDGRIVLMDDYRRLVLVDKSSSDVEVTAGKGHFELLKALGNALCEDALWPISLEEQISATRISFEVEKALRGGEFPH